MRARASGYQQRQRYYHHYIIIRRIGCSTSSSLSRALIDLVSRLVSCGRPLAHSLSPFISKSVCLPVCLSVRLSLSFHRLLHLSWRRSVTQTLSLSLSLFPSITLSPSLPHPEIPIWSKTAAVRSSVVHHRFYIT